MKVGYSLGLSFKPGSRPRLCLTLIITFMVVSFPILIFLNPVLVSAKSNNIDTSSQHSAFSLEDTSPPPMSSTNVSPLDSDFTTQAPLQIPRTLQSTDLVNSLAFYEVTFITSTTGVIDKIQMQFPGGTGVGAAGIIERVGIGGGSLIKAASTLIYDVTNPVSVPAGTFIRLGLFGIKNPNFPSTTLQTLITTGESDGTTIDGPSPTNVYTIKKIVSSDIADGAVTNPKIADFAVTNLKIADEAISPETISTSFVKNGFLNDGATGWNPNGVTTVFEISEPAVKTGSAVVVNVDSTVAADPVCSASGTSFEIEIWCTSPPAEGSTLTYAVINGPFS